MAATLVAIFACLSLTAPAAGMVGGTTPSPEPRWAVRLDADGRANCSGTLIARQWVLTAAHCFDGQTSGTLNTARVGGLAWTITEKPQLHPSYRSVNAWDEKVWDLALVKLPVDVVAGFGARTLPLASVADLNYFKNRGVTAFGYGRTKRNEGPMTSSIKKTPDHAWSMGASCQARLHECFVRAGWAADSSSIQKGDSGGPWVGWRNGGWRILAVTSGRFGRSCDWDRKKRALVNCPENLIHGASPAHAASWIKKVTAPPTAPLAPVAPAPVAPAPGPAPVAPPPVAAPARRAITVDNRVTNGMGMREDTTPVRLTTQPWVRCGSRGCNINGTEAGSGHVYNAAVCQRTGERTTNGHDTSAADDANPLRFESTRYYGVRLTNGVFGYISEVWIRAADRGGLGLPGC
ncbi:S1 family peptidase [Miltoncostaea oceani]|uniref:S1 family peptidase n=1 Tax=Miltoncostaea oceani TaxID=2843216 RepID=UPI001C3CF42C|nr:trypsin-like serine protease [Miltoncostaea oceani]